MLRRSFLAAAAAVAATPAVPSLAKTIRDRVGDREALHLLNRVGLGPTLADVQRVKAIGVDAYIAEQLRPEALTEPPELTERLGKLPTLQLDPVRLFREYGPLLPVNGVKADPEEQKARRQRAQIILEEACAARIWRALYSPCQLREAMVDFWYNHFNVFAGKGLDYLWIGTYEAEAIRPHALGRFRDLLGATAHHPAMLFYLDNVQNSAAGTKLPDGRELGLNENYARELMELHTLGVDGGYTQDDVVALARILTGWGMLPLRAPPAEGSGFVFRAQLHDNQPKHFLGRDIQPNGEREGEEALDMLARSPATARHIAAKLAGYFVSDTPPAALVERLANRFQETDGDIAAVLHTLFGSAEFHASFGAKYKSPYRYVLSAARAAGITVEKPQPLVNAMVRQGQPPFRCMTPDGFRDSEDAWLSPDATMQRIAFATALGTGNLPLRGEKSPPVDAARLQALLGPALTPKTHAAIEAAAPELRTALILGSPDFMRR